MKLKNPLLVVTDIDKSVKFYKNVLGLTKQDGVVNSATALICYGCVTVFFRFRNI